jgi:alpha-tubulin suppressor-like RCC1 family protein
MAIKTNGTMWLWGRNNYGRLGDNTTVYKSSPIQIGALTTWSKIAASEKHCMAIKTDGTMWLWGGNSYGRLGDNTVANKSSPVQIGALTTWGLITGGSGQFSMAISGE